MVKRLLLVPLLFALLALLALPAAAVTVDSLAAVVDGTVLTRSQVEAFMSQQPPGELPDGASGEKQALEELIERALVEHEADRRGITATDADVESAVKDIRERNGLGPDAFRAAVTGRGMSWEDYLAEVRFQIIRAKVAGRVLRSRMRVGDEALREYYLKNVAEYREPGAVRLCHIEVPAADRERAEEIRRRVQAGEDPEQVAREVSERLDGASTGDTGFVPLANLSEQVRRAVGNLPEGGVSPVVDLGGKCQVFAVLERRDGRIPPFEEVRDKIRELYFQDMEEELYQTWLESLKEKARIERRM